MKKIVFLMILLFSFSIANSQNLRVSLLTGIGISDKTFIVPGNNNFTRYDYQDAKSTYSLPISLHFNFPIIENKALRVNLGSGITFTHSNYYFLIIDPINDFLLESVRFSDDFLSIPLTVGVEKSAITDYLSFGLQVGLYYNIPMQHYSRLHGNVEKMYGFVDYEYEINKYSIKGLSNFISLNTNLKLTNQLDMMLSLSYISRNRSQYYYNYGVTHYITDPNTGNVSTIGYTIEDSYVTRLDDNYFYLKVGVTKTIPLRKAK